MADGSGYQYKRNRYYNPGSGQFTQEDPIGLAGGINAYGFGGGDPISYADPFGLCIPFPYCLVAAGESGAAIGAGIGTVIEPVGGTAIGAVVGMVLGVGAALASTAGMIWATKQMHRVGQAEAQLDVALSHISQSQGLGPNDEDPNGKRRDWTKHATKALNNARTYAEKVVGKVGRELRERVEAAGEKLRLLNRDS